MSLGSDDAKKFHPIWLSFGRYEVCRYVGGGGVRAAWLRRPCHFAVVVAAAATACAATAATTAEEKIYASSAVLLRFKP